MFPHFLCFTFALLFYCFICDDINGSYSSFKIKKGIKFNGKPKELISLENDIDEAKTIIHCGTYCVRDADCKAFYIKGNITNIVYLYHSVHIWMKNKNDWTDHFVDLWKTC